MKKIICCILACLMLFSMSACSHEEEENNSDLFDAAVDEADEIFDEASDGKVKYKTKVADDGEEFYRVKATFSADEFSSVEEMKEYAEEIIDGPYKDAKKALKETELEIRIICIDGEENECFYIINGKITDSVKEKDTTSSDSGADEPEKGPVSSEFNYGGQSFTFLIVEYGSMFYHYNGGYIDAESYTGECINDKIFERNLDVESKFNISIDTNVASGGNAGEVLSQYNLAGDFSYDVVYAAGSQLGICITEGYLMDFNDLEYVDYSKSYWRPSTIEDLTVSGKQYVSSNDITMSAISNADCYFYNQTIAENYGVEDDFGSPYNMVVDGNWTYDKMLEMIQAVSVDTDGSSTITKDDIYGLIGGSSRGYLEGCGIFYTIESESGFEPNIYSERSMTVIKDTYEVLNNSKYVKSYEEIMEGGDYTGYDDGWQYARSFFGKGHALFMSATSHCATESSMVEMEDDRWILPAPKYDAVQEQYVSMVSRNAFIFALPRYYNVTVSDAGAVRTGVILDYMAAKSNEMLLPAYIESRLMEGLNDTSMQLEMIELIHSTARFEIGNIAGFATASSVIDNFCANPSTMASAYNRNKAAIQKEMNDFYIAVTTLE
ncbi:MAG: hypothetical protein IJ389_06830 [Clostridia bacterium]|nr:hypothetical protein [Clostridia bacterium]